MKNKTQRRELILKECEDGTYTAIGFAWDVPDLKKEEVLEFVNSWINGELREDIPEDILKESHSN